VKAGAVASEELKEATERPRKPRVPRKPKIPRKVEIEKTDELV
jgi:hypothetical protein